MCFSGDSNRGSLRTKWSHSVGITEVGDYIQFDKLIGGKLAFGYDYTKTLVKINVLTMCIKLTLDTIFSPLGPPRGGPSDLKGAQSAKKVSIWDTILRIFFDLFLSWMQDRPERVPKEP